MGCSQDPKGKADGDYSKRTSSPPAGVVPSETTFVFVTPRRWDGKTVWVEERRREGEWADVRVYDSSNIEQWLDQAHGPRLWLARRLGMPSDSLDLEACWTEWSLGTSPPTPAALMLAGRDEAKAHLWRWLSGSPSALPVVCQDSTEAAAFLYAVLGVAEPGIRRKWLDRAVVVRSDADLREVTPQRRSSLVVALGCGIEAARAAAARGHHVLLGGVPNPRGEQLVLGPLNRPTVSAVLESLGFGEERAKRLSRESGGDLLAIRRILGAATNPIPADLATLVLVPAVDVANDVDRAALLRVVHRPEADVRDLLRRHSAGANAPIKRDGDTYRWVSQLDSWMDLARLLAPADLRRFAEVAVEVLTEDDPQFALPPAERWLAAVKGAVRSHSSGLRRGMLQTAVLCGAEADALTDPAAGQDAAGRVVFHVLRTCTSFERLAAVRDDLPLLAEADPRAFLSELGDLVEHRREVLQDLFAASGNRWGDTDYSTGLVWALEMLAWSPDHLAPASLLLADLAEVESEFGRLGGRCLSSLREIFLVWQPHTTGTLRVRLAALRALLRRHPDVGYRLIVMLLPSFDGDISTGTHKPEWRSWLSSWRDGGDPTETRGMLHGVWDLAVEGVECDASRWPMLLPSLHRLSHDVHLPRALALLDAVLPDQLSPDVRAELWAGLRSQLHRHRGFPDAGWSLDEDRLAPLVRAYERMTPDDLLDRFAWLFQKVSDLPDFRGHDWAAEQEALAAARRNAVRDMIEIGGAASILDLARRADVHWDLALQVVSLGGQALALELLGGLSATDEPWSRDFRAGLGGALVQQAGGVVPSVPLDALGARQRAQVALGYPLGPATWDQVEEWGVDARDEYWRWVRAWLREPTQDDLRRAVDHLLGVSRAFDAIHLIAMQLHGEEARAALDPAHVARTLHQVAEQKGHDRSIGTMDAYHAGQLLDFLDAQGEAWRGELIALEWKWFGVLQGYREPKWLHEALSNDPEFFVTLLSMVYPAEGEQARETDQQKAVMASQAWHVLHGWDRLPGMTDAGLEDGAFRDWMDRARRLAREAGRGRVADRAIGAVLARSPNGRDDAWPHESIRDLFEVARPFADLRQGFVTGRYNAQGVYSKSIGEGGRQERDLAEFYRGQAHAVGGIWPLTAAVLEDIARRYDGHARSEDLRGIREHEDYIWAASTTDRLRVWIDSRLTEGVFAAELSEIRSFLGVPDAEMRSAIEQVMADGKVAVSDDGSLALIALSAATVAGEQ
jgi:hypothetical protein